MSPTKKAAPRKAAVKPPERPPRVRLVEADGALRAVYPWHQYRFLLDDGATLDVVAVRDDSDLREAVLAESRAERIAGVATVIEGMTAP